MNKDGLNDNQEIFVREYLTNGNNATAAYIVAYPDCDPDYAGTQAGRLMDDSHAVRKVIDREMQQLFSTYKITQERILQEMACLAFYDPDAFYDDEGNPLPLSEIPEDARRAISGLDVEELWERDGRGNVRVKSGNLRKLKVTSKDKALEMLGRYHKMFVDKSEVDVRGEANVNVVSKIDLDDRIAQILDEKVDAKVKEALDAMLQ